MNSTSIGTGRSLADLQARPASESDPARPRGAAFDAMLGAAFVSAARPPKAPPIAPPALDVTSFRNAKVADGSGQMRRDGATAGVSSARDDRQDQEPGHRSAASRPPADHTAMAGVLRPLIRSLARDKSDKNAKSEGAGSSPGAPTDASTSPAQDVAGGVVPPTIVPQPVAVAAGAQATEATPATADPGTAKPDPAHAGPVTAAAALLAGFASAGAVGALGTAAVTEAKDQAKQVADSARQQKRDETAAPADGKPADLVLPPIDGAKVISAHTAGDRNAGTGKQNRDASATRGEQPGAPAGDPIPVAPFADHGLTPASMANSPNGAPAPSTAGAASEPVVAGTPVIAEPAVPGMGRRDQVVLQLTDDQGDLGRIRVSVRGDSVRATILPNDGALASRLTAEARSLERSLSDQGFKDARVTVQAPRPAADASPIWNQAAKDSRMTVADTKAQAGSRSQDETAHDSRDGEPRDDPRTRDQRGQRGQRARQQKEKEPLR